HLREALRRGHCPWVLPQPKVAGLRWRRFDDSFVGCCRGQGTATTQGPTRLGCLFRILAGWQDAGFLWAPFGWQARWPFDRVVGHGHGKTNPAVCESSTGLRDCLL